MTRVSRTTRFRVPIVGVELPAPASVAAAGRLADRLWPDGMDMVAPVYGTGRWAHFEGCPTCRFIYDGQAPEAARERHRIRAGRAG